MAIFLSNAEKQKLRVHDQLFVSTWYVEITVIEQTTNNTLKVRALLECRRKPS